MCIHRAKFSLPAPLKSHWRILTVFLLALILSAVSPSPDVRAGRSRRLQAGDIPHGLTILKSSAPMTQFKFKSDYKIPRDFFDPGSKAFKKTVPIIGNPISSLGATQLNAGLADTVVRRLETAMLPSVGSSDTIPIEIVALSLVSVEPITVKYSGGPSQQWNVSVILSSTPQPQGMMTIRKDTPTGGTFDATFPVLPRLIFTRVGDNAQRILDAGASGLDVINLRIERAPWVTDCMPGSLVLPGVSEQFCPGVFQPSAKNLTLDLMPAPIRLTELGAGQGVMFKQIDFTWTQAVTMNSTTGEILLDVAAIRGVIGTGTNYINVFTGLGWVVQNLPVFETFTYPMIATRFQIGEANGSNVSSLSARVVSSPVPLTGQVTTPSSIYPVGDKQYNAQGRQPSVSGGTAPAPPRPNAVSFTRLPLLECCYQANHPNIEAADDQCGPAAMANSLQWLEDTFRINIPHPHQQGLGNDGSLVGELDQAMNRGFRDRRDGDPISDEDFLEGKLEYIADNGLGDKLTVKHQDDGAGGSLPGGADFTRHGLTSTGNGSTTADFIIKEICDGEDVELGFTYPGGGGHWVNVVKAGRINGVPFIGHVSDTDQSDDTQGTGQVDFSFLLDSDGDGLPNLVNDANAPNADIVVSESPKEGNPPTIPPGSDTFPTGGSVTLQLQTQQVTVALSSQGLTNTVITRQGQVGATIDTEMVSLELRGFSSLLGMVEVKIGMSQGLNATSGRLTNIQQRPDGSLLMADSFFDIFCQIDFDEPGGGRVMAKNQTALRATAQPQLTSLWNTSGNCAQFIWQGMETLTGGRGPVMLTGLILIPNLNAPGTACASGPTSLRGRRDSRHFSPVTRLIAFQHRERLR